MAVTEEQVDVEVKPTTTYSNSDIKHNRFYMFFKRAFDLCASFVAFLILLIPMGIIACIIRIDSKGKAIYSQKRMGYKGKPFTFYKFRSMKIDTPVCASRDLENADLHITGVGKILRKTSLDELPQLINIIKGDMSFIGPRPVILDETELIEKRINGGAYEVRPGLTGYAQINGRDFVGIDSKAEYDCYYAHHISFAMDFKIFFKTIMCVLRCADINEGSVNQEKEKENALIGK